MILMIVSFKNGGIVCQSIFAFFILLIVWSITVQKYQNISPNISWYITVVLACAYYNPLAVGFSKQPIPDDSTKSSDVLEKISFQKIVLFVINAATYQICFLM